MEGKERRGASHESEYSVAYSGSFDDLRPASDGDVSQTRCTGVYQVNYSS
jgi:hypothetical protein